MATIRMDINPEVLEYYIEQSEMDVEFLKGKNNLANIEEWIDGSKQPTLNQLRELAKKLRVPLGYLVLKEPVDDSPPLLDYRTVDSIDTSKNSRELIDTIRNVQNQQVFVSEYRKKEGHSTLGYLDYFTLDEPTENIVEFCRTLLDLDADWQKQLGDLEPFKFFREKLNKTGVLVLVNGIVGQNTHRSLDIEEFRAFALIDDYAPAIFINTNDTKNGQVFSLLHEFAHLLFGREEIYNVSNILNKEPSLLERKGNEFASEILVPNELFKDAWHQFSNNELLEKTEALARQFKVSMTVVAKKAYINHFINECDYNAVAEYNQDKYRESKIMRKESSGGDYWNNLNYKMDPVVFDTVRKSFYQGDIQFTKALKLLNIKAKAFDYLEQN